MAKMISVAFYFGEIDCAAFERRFGVPLRERFAAQVAFLEQRDLMHEVDGKLRMTRQGAWSFGGVVAQFYSPAVQQVLLER
jgi:oxygen-independent coproporphyrinogen-3 oxidase